MNPGQKRNPLIWWVVAAIVVTLALWTTTVFLGQSLHQKKQRLTRNMTTIQNKITSIARKKAVISENSPVMNDSAVNPAELYAIIVNLAEEADMNVESFTWHKPGAAQVSQGAPQNSGEGTDLTMEMKIKGNYRNFTRFLLEFSGKPEFEFINKITLTAISETNSSLKATLMMSIPN